MSNWRLAVDLNKAQIAPINGYLFWKRKEKHKLQNKFSYTRLLHALLTSMGAMRFDAEPNIYPLYRIFRHLINADLFLSTLIL